MILCVVGLIAGIVPFHDFDHFIEEHDILFLDFCFFIFLLLNGFSVISVVLAAEGIQSRMMCLAS